MGVHTGDSITVAPAQTLTDKEYQILRDASLKIIREIGVDTGGSNIQFAINPDNGRLVVIEMNPRVSRSSALASKATGFPIAKIAAKLAVGYTLDEITQRHHPRDPGLLRADHRLRGHQDPALHLREVPAADATLTTQMKSVGEVMAIGRTFKESLAESPALAGDRLFRFRDPAFRQSQETSAQPEPPRSSSFCWRKLRVPNWERLWYLGDALRSGMTGEDYSRNHRHRSLVPAQYPPDHRDGRTS